MKKIILMTFLMAGMTIMAQPRNNKHQGNGMDQFTSEQRSELQVKKLTLELDLNESQQKEIKAFIADKNTKMEAHKTAMKAMREKGTKPTSDERFAMKSKMLDEQIAAKKRMQKILNEKQFEKWTALKEEHQGDRKGNRQGNQQGKHPKNQERRG
ncbi:Spy/CpxP family protein refolding chaperone [Flavobacterium limnophilum]|uniref:Spy/CpxP family protein refolding chaperone n=1 Tax=Flavobacterium limnophilum TaxID=3003262 RepID=UPI002482DBF8|nr:Spy/CpxP family protein refolding chaperone [Flavobacterium limnophilum]